jgi:hypothetical protein
MMEVCERLNTLQADSDELARVRARARELLDRGQITKDAGDFLESLGGVEDKPA